MQNFGAGNRLCRKLAFGLIGLGAGCASRSDEALLEEIQRRVQGDVDTHTEIVEGASGFTALHLDLTVEPAETVELKLIKVDLVDGNCLLIKTDRDPWLITEVNGLPVRPMAGREIRYRLAQDVIEAWPPFAFDDNEACLPAVSEDVAELLEEGQGVSGDD